MRYLALGDSMSIDKYTGVIGGGAVSQLFGRLERRQGNGWTLDNKTFDGCTMPQVPLSLKGDLITITIGGNDLRMGVPVFRKRGLHDFELRHLELMNSIFEQNPHSSILVGNVYHPDYELDDALEALLTEANQIIAKNVQAIGAKLVDICGSFLHKESFYLCHSIEPNLCGATQIAGLFERAMRS